MKLNGQEIKGPNVITLALPRGDDEAIIIKAKSVLDLSEFDKLCPEPKPPIRLKPGGRKIEDKNDDKYKTALADFASNRIHYMVIKSLEATEELTWDTVILSDPSTWKNYQEELKKAFFSDIEINRIVNAVFEANCLSEMKLEEARQRFLQQQEELVKS